MSDVLPKSMNALVLEDFGEPLEVKRRKVPIPGKGQVLVKIDSSPVNPSDQALMGGSYHSPKQTPFIPGFEGSGVIVSTGKDFMSRRLLGKRVACISPLDGDGTWAEYMVTSNKMVIPLRGNIDIEQASMLVVNPLSAIALLKIIKKGGHKIFANTAATGALGMMLNKMCKMEGIEVVNIVRREELRGLLISQGYNKVVDTSEKDYQKKMKEIFHEHHVTLAIDAVSGTSVFDLMRAMPSGGEVIVYGGLSEKEITIHPADVIFRKQRLSGFWLTEWIAKKNLLQLMSIFSKAQKFLENKHHITISKRITLEEAINAIPNYTQNRSSGKLIVKPNLNR